MSNDQLHSQANIAYDEGQSSRRPHGLSQNQLVPSEANHPNIEQIGNIAGQPPNFQLPASTQVFSADIPPQGYNPYHANPYQYQNPYGPSQNQGSINHGYPLPGHHMNPYVPGPVQYYQKQYPKVPSPQQYDGTQSPHNFASHQGANPPQHYGFAQNDVQRADHSATQPYQPSAATPRQLTSVEQAANRSPIAAVSTMVQPRSTAPLNLKPESGSTQASSGTSHHFPPLSNPQNMSQDRPMVPGAQNSAQSYQQPGPNTGSYPAKDSPIGTQVSIPVSHANIQLNADPQKPPAGPLFAPGPVELPYESSSLTWNTDKTLNNQHRYCYCGDDRNLLDVDVQCSQCANFFHGRCVGIDMGPVVPFMTNYDFKCKNCSTTLRETFSRTHCPWKNICASVMANLVLMKIRINNPTWGKASYAAKHTADLFNDAGWYTRKADIIPFLGVPRHWAALCTGKDKNETNSWSSTLANALVSNPDLFRAHDESSRSANSPYILGNSNLFAFRAGYLSHVVKHTVPRKRKTEGAQHATPRPQSQLASTQVKAESQSMTDPPKDTANSPMQADSLVKVEQPAFPAASNLEEDKSISDEPPSFTPTIPTIKKEPIRPTNAAPKEVNRDRKTTGKKAVVAKKGDAAIPAKLIRRPPPYKPQDFHAIPRAPGINQVEGQFQDGPYYSITDIPYNKRGFKYTLCEAAPAMPGIMYRQVEVGPHKARLDWSDMSPYMYLSKDGQSATTDKGFRMGRANVGVREGQWYWEVKVLRGNGEHGGHVRLGVARREASLDGPVGFDGYSYGVRDKGGEKMHLSRPRPFMDSFGSGDVIGFHLTLPAAIKTEVVRDRIPIRYRQQLYFEQFEYTSRKEMDDLLQPGTNPGKTTDTLPAKLEGSSLRVYKNGELQGTAFEDLFSFFPPHSQTTRDVNAPDDGSLGYFPAVSVYAGGSVRLNFGPSFEYAPRDDLLESRVVRPMSERYDEQIAEDVVFDLMEEVDIEEDLQELSLDGQQQVEVEAIREIAEYD